MVLPFICTTSSIRQKILESLENHGIETRPFLVGNLACGFYIGNNQFIGRIEMSLLEKAIAEVRV